MESVSFSSELPFKEQLSLFTQAMDSASCGITVADAREEDMPLVYVNDAFTRMTGYSRDEVLGKNCRFLQADEENVEAKKQIRSAFQRQVAVTVVLRNRRKDGTLFHNELHLAPVSATGDTITHYVGIQTDVSHRYGDSQK